jgi:hypothetical protein
MRTEEHPPFEAAAAARMPLGFLAGRIKCHTMELRLQMSKRELIAMQLDHIPEQDLDKLLAFLRSLKETHAETATPTLAAETSLAKDWLTPEEDAAWANL